MTNSENKIKHEIQDDGTEIWKDSNEIFHQHDDLPAIISPHGTEEYYKKGKLYRKFGPRSKEPDGTEWWNTKQYSCLIHRENGAATIFTNGKRQYHIDEKIVSYDKFRKQDKTRNPR